MEEVIYTWCYNESFHKNINITRKVFENDAHKISQTVYNIDPTGNFGDCRIFNQDSLKFLYEKSLRDEKDGGSNA